MTEKKASHKNTIVTIVEVVLCIPLTLVFIGYFGLVIGLACGFSLLLILYLFNRTGLLETHDKFKISDFINTIVLLTATSLLFFFLADYLVPTGPFAKKSLFSIFFSFFTFYPILSVSQKIRLNNEKKKRPLFPFLYLSISVITFDFILFINRPLEIYLNNVNDFSFSCFDLLFSMLLPITVSFIILFFLSLLPYKIITLFDSVCSAFIFSMYIQLMFFNQYIGSINGGTYLWKNHIPHTVINILLWGIIIIAVTYFSVKSDKIHKLVNYGKLIVLILLSVSLTYLFIKAPKDVFERRQFYISGEEQFTVGSNDNVIVFVMDGVDNSFIKEVLKNNPSIFDDFSDFTIYLNTCSIYDMSDVSVKSMLYGYRGTDDSYKSIPFLERFRNNNYRILLYAEEAIKEASYTDNYLSVTDTNNDYMVDYSLIRNGMTALSNYSVLPCIFKDKIDTNKVNFAYCVLYDKTIHTRINGNKEFENHLNLKYNNQSDNCFIYYHLGGTHYPCDDYIKETEYCLTIYQKYISQLKELGVYDNSTLIFCADHGIHDDIDSKYPYPTAATPMFMIKKKNEHHNSVQLSNIPVYYTDFQSTVLKASGLFDNQTDYAVFGKSIYDFQENELRERTWFDMPFTSNNNVIRKYTYTGDTRELERVVKEEIYETTDSYAFTYSE